MVSFQAESIETRTDRARITQTVSPRTFEPELNQPTPRRVRLRAPIAMSVFRMATIVPGLLAFLFVESASGTTLEFLSHLVFGRTVEGKVVAKAIVPGDKRDAHFVDYNYEVDDKNYTGRVQVSNDKYAAINVGDPIPLQTISCSPESSRTRMGVGFEFLVVVVTWALAAVPCLIFAAFFRRLYFVPWTQRRLLRFGVVTSAVVANIESGEGKGGNSIWIHYEFETMHNGKSLITKGSVVVWDSEVKTMQVGDQLTVIFDQRVPDRSVPYPFAEYAAVSRPELVSSN